MELDPKKFYKFLAPRPTVLLTTVDKSEGVLNTTPFSFTMPVSIDPPLIAIAVGSTKHALKNIRSTREFVINIPSVDLLENFWKCLQENPAGVSELRKAGLTEMISSKVLAPSITECIAWFECLLDYEKELGDHTLVVGEVVKVFVRDEIISEGFIDITRARNLLHIGGSKFAVAEREIKAGSMRVTEVMSRERSRRQSNRRMPPETSEAPVFRPDSAPDRQRKTRQFNRLMDKLNLVDNGKPNPLEETAARIPETPQREAIPRRQDSFRSQEFEDTVQVLKNVTESRAPQKDQGLPGKTDGKAPVNEPDGLLNSRSLSEVVKLCAQDASQQKNNIPRATPVQERPPEKVSENEPEDMGSGLFKARSVSGVVTLSKQVDTVQGKGPAPGDNLQNNNLQKEGSPIKIENPGKTAEVLKPAASPDSNDLKETPPAVKEEAPGAGVPQKVSDDVVGSDLGSGESLVGVEGARSVVEKVRSANTLNAKVQHEVQSEKESLDITPKDNKTNAGKTGKESPERKVKETAPAVKGEMPRAGVPQHGPDDVVGSDLGSGESLVGVEGARSVVEKVRSANTLNAKVQQETQPQAKGVTDNTPVKAAPAAPVQVNKTPVKINGNAAAPKASGKAMGDHVLGVVKKVKAVTGPSGEGIKDLPGKGTAKTEGMEQVKEEVYRVRNGEKHILGVVKKIDPEYRSSDQAKATKDVKSQPGSGAKKPGAGKDKK